MLELLDLESQEDDLVAIACERPCLLLLQALVDFGLFSYFKKHSKKLFDMCNIGEEYYLGQKRNEVLRKCNDILNT